MMAPTGWIERQVSLVVRVLMAGWLGTLLLLGVLWYFGIQQPAGEMFHGILFAWMGELLFFTVIGGAITVISFRNPMQETFDDRLKIMFGRASVPDAVIKYNKELISKSAGYARSGKRTVRIEDYDPQIQAYKTRIRTEYEIVNLFPDVAYKDSVTIAIKPDKFPNGNPVEIGRVVSIRVGDEEVVHNPLIITEENFSTEVELSIPRNGTKTFSLEFITWMAVDALQSLRPQRVVEEMTMEIVSECDLNPRVNIDGDVRILLYNQPMQFPLVQGISPGERVCVYTPLTPDLAENAGAPV